MKKIRLFINETTLREGLQIKVEGGDFDYLSKVMRQKINDEIFIFNGIDGEFRAMISSLEKRFLILEVKEKITELKKSANITLAFALLKNTKIDFIAMKGVELGVTSFQPLITQHTIVDKINEERLSANIKEALEQCERNDLAKIFPLKKLEKFLDEENQEKIFILCDESHQGAKASELLPKLDLKNKEIVILIGPEGGFAKEEFTKMRQIKNLHSMSLGARILRADTAIVAALALVGEFLKDF